jgi:hypothetical protein
MSGLRLALVALLIASTALFAAGVIAGLGLAVAAAAPLAQRPTVLLSIAATAAAWAALDVREAVHQIDESRTGVTILAIAVALLHLAAAGLAARERAALGPAA